jgi:hypothetical protein
MNVNSQSYGTVTIHGAIKSVASSATKYEQSIALTFELGETSETVTIKFKDATTDQVLTALSGLIDQHLAQPDESYHSHYSE